MPVPFPSPPSLASSGRLVVRAEVLGCSKLGDRRLAGSVGPLEHGSADSKVPVGRLCVWMNSLTIPLAPRNLLLIPREAPRSVGALEVKLLLGMAADRSVLLFILLAAWSLFLLPFS